MRKSRYKMMVVGLEVVLLFVAGVSLYLYTNGNNWIVYNTDAGMSLLLYAIPIGAILGFSLLKLCSYCKIARSTYASLPKILAMTALYSPVSLVALGLYTMNQSLSTHSPKEVLARILSKDCDRLWNECTFEIRYGQKSTKLTTDLSESKIYSVGEKIVVQVRIGYSGHEIFSIKPKT